MNAPTPLSSFPKISALPGATLVNGVLQQTARRSLSVGVRGRRGRNGSNANVDLSDILKRLLALEERMQIVEDRLDAASIEAACNGGNVTVTLNL